MAMSSTSSLEEKTPAELTRSEAASNHPIAVRSAVFVASAPEGSASACSATALALCLGGAERGSHQWHCAPGTSARCICPWGHEIYVRVARSNLCMLCCVLGGLGLEGEGNSARFAFGRHRTTSSGRSRTMAGACHVTWNNTESGRSSRVVSSGSTRVDVRLVAIATVPTLPACEPLLARSLCSAGLVCVAC